MKRHFQKLSLNRETITLLTRFDLDLAKGGRPSDTAVGGECLTDGCSINYSCTVIKTCDSIPI
jgi:hypothetical protein